MGAGNCEGTAMQTDPTNNSAPFDEVLDGATPQTGFIPLDLQPVTEIAKDSTLPLEDWRRLFDVNLFGAVLCARACRPSMAARGGGVMLNQSSNSSYLGVGAYSISKLALNGLTLSLAQELAPDGIRVVGIAPGMVGSEAVLERLEDVHKNAVLGAQLVKRWGRVEDLVGMVLLLCSDDASFATGQTVTVDGGFVKRI